MRGAGFALLIDALPVQSGPLPSPTFPPGALCCVLWDERPDSGSKFEISQHSRWNAWCSWGWWWRRGPWGQAGFGGWVAQVRLGRSAARGAGRLVPGGGRRQAEVAQNAMESSP